MPGAPVEQYPDSDERFPREGAARYNDFDFVPTSQRNCPFASHIRKTKPRSGVDNVDKFDIMRRGLPYGPDHDPETEPHKTTQDRGLMFVCYQTSLNNGFSFIKNSKHAFPSKDSIRPLTAYSRVVQPG
jgi:deferrochelatase/peroxidase EfeB